MSLSDELPQPRTTVADAINNGDEDTFVAAFAPEEDADDGGRVLRCGTADVKCSKLA